ncbi:EamA family transporter RarD [Salisediminibacterium halotolerans]|uniref:EamA family transporter RarD n=1 Tax=Salisediminibacterium halotolerans TaxID=517425 RepID=UPI000EB523CE|nr:EamA family transporter RarD [Salisediminibacterium halotolerans]RLJ71801.1 chloramphenicol-sensitive protein RarD [Actinophytocola xinjiangensis]RPE86951.1 chloramphenicol-sensitive protein RarD [Salisediminibacterium halotolerans]TWG33014.1 chloramphenicol-sensitive protein RarD [Salisediminibacterium halotolerans]GEL08591.1 chloramphenicol-sensitive protein RarD [Salisediminibacterium halotolerans]
MTSAYQDLRKGVSSGIGAYLLWGFLPIYWKLVDHIPADEVLAHRIIWSVVFLGVLFFLMNRIDSLKTDLRYIKTHPKIFVAIFLTALLISINWVTFIWAVANERIVEVSLGYYINPLINVVLGVLFFKESLSYAQRIAVLLALSGVTVLTFSFGEIPYVALILAFSFGFYGLVKKQTQVGSMTGLMIETILLMPAALVYLFWLHGSLTEALHLSGGENTTLWLLIGSGAATAVPLILFGYGAQHIPLSLIGFLQYIAPTTMLLLGVLLYQEPFTTVHAVSFLLIWSGLILYTISKLKRPVRTAST